MLWHQHSTNLKTAVRRCMWNLGNNDAFTFSLGTKAANLKFFTPGQALRVPLISKDLLIFVPLHQEETTNVINQLFHYLKAPFMDPSRTHTSQTHRKTSFGRYAQITRFREAGHHRGWWPTEVTEGAVSWRELWTSTGEYASLEQFLVMYYRKIALQGIEIAINNEMNKKLFPKQKEPVRD